jgi:hypothetical protein
LLDLAVWVAVAAVGFGVSAFLANHVLAGVAMVGIAVATVGIGVGRARQPISHWLSPLFREPCTR